MNLSSTLDHLLGSIQIEYSLYLRTDFGPGTDCKILVLNEERFNRAVLGTNGDFRIRGEGDFLLAIECSQEEVSQR